MATPKKTTELDAVTSLNDADLLYVVTDVSTVPLSKKITIANVKTSINAGDLYLDQTTPQTIINGTPIFNVGIKANAITEINLNTVSAPASLTGTALRIVGADNSPVRIGMSSFGTGGMNAFACRHARNTAASPQAVQNGDQLFSLEGWGYGATDYCVSAKVMVRGYAAETWTDSAQGSKGSIWSTPIGSIVPSEILKWSDVGVINIPNLTASKVVFTDASKNLTSTGIGTSAQFIKGDGSLDSSTYLTSVTAHNLLSTTHGDTTADTVVRGDIITGQGATPKWARLAFPASPTGKVLIASATDIGWSASALGTAAYTASTAYAAALSGTINEIAYFNSATTIASLAVATYPSLTELSYVKGVTSAIQTQIGDKAPSANPTFTGTVILPKTIEIQDTSADHQYVLAVSELTADRTITLPLLTGNDTFVFQAHTQTLTNKRITKRVTTTTDDATAVIDIDTCDVYELSAVANATEFTTTGTPTDGQTLMVRIKDAGAAKALTWTGFTAIGVTLPTTTVAGKWHYVGCVYNLASTAWHCIAVGVQA
jgi:hypothetical protein